MSEPEHVRVTRDDKTSRGISGELIDDRDETADLPTLEGRKLGPYRVVRKLGGGSMGEVYEGYDERLQRTVALKFLPAEWSRDPDAKERFHREARAASALDHPGICTIYDIGESHDEGIPRLFIVMAYYPGKTLKHKLDRGPIELEETRDLVIQIARGLDRAHQAGIVHRDLKPANVMITEHGEAKIVDFGIAKIAGDAALTRTGSLIGTPFYMSPEQAHGAPVDGRSDLWSLGVMLYEMLSGQKPFRGANPQAVIYSILRHDPEPVRRLRPDVPADLERVVARLLEKDPKKRHASARRLLSDLGSDPGTGTATMVMRVSRSEPRRRPPAFVAIGAAALIAIVVLVAVFTGLRREETPATPAPAGIDTAAGVDPVGAAPTALAVLSFHNLTGDRELDWLRTGLQEMLVTDLAQSPELEVMSTSSLYQVLAEMNALDADRLPIDRLGELARRTDVAAVVQGSYARLGDVLRVDFTLEDVTSGRILKSASFRGQGEESLFTLADELAAAVRNNFEVIRPAASPTTIRAATTASVEAWRLYSEGLALIHQMKRQEAVPLLEKAVEIDPAFATAHADLGLIHAHLGHTVRSRAAMARAVELIDRLPLDQRYRIQGIYYGGKWATTGRAIDVYEEALRHYPEREAWRNNLARRYVYFERYDDAVEQFRRLVDGGTSFPGTYIDLAQSLTALDQPEGAMQVLTGLARDRPSLWSAPYFIGWLLVDRGELDEATSFFDRAEELRPGEPLLHHARWRLHVLREDWDAAERAAQRSAGLDDPYYRFRGATELARIRLFRGELEQALTYFEAAIDAYPQPGPFPALARCFAAEVLLALGDPAGALEQTERAREEGRDEWPELQGTFLAALSEQTRGRPAAADALVRKLEARWREQPNVVQERQLLHLRGLLAFERDDPETAVARLREAAALLPPKSIKFLYHMPTDAVPVAYALGRAELAAGRPERARTWLERVVASGSEHIEQPIPYARSFELLERVYRELGEDGKARSSRERFRRLWPTAQPDR